VIETVARTIKPTIPPADQFARYGGARFAILLHEMGLSGALDFAESVRRTIESTKFDFEGSRIPVTVSVGVSTLLPADAGNAAILRERAGSCLKEAKKAGQNCVRG
jgi:diguanylate cyclase (GGDEF)-like protein